MIGDLMNILFRTGVEYDATRNQFNVKPEDIPRIQQTYEQALEEESWFRRSETTQRARGWDDFNF